VRRIGLAAVVLLVATLGPAVAGAGKGEPSRGRVDLQVAMRVDGSCGRYGENLPTMVTASGLEPGVSTGTVTVCARSQGAADSRLTLGVIEVVQTDVACTGDEASVDASCGGDQAGELGENLTVTLAAQPKCKGPFGAARAVGFSALATGAVVVTPVMKQHQVDCVAVTLAYAASPLEAVARAQTDRVRWRYAFDLSG
jgi:hypothetical protein